VCVISRFMTRQMSLTHALTQLASTTIRSSSSVPPGRRGRAPASTRTKGSPARCRRIDARAGFDRFRNHSLINSSRIKFGSNRPCRTRRGRNCIGLDDTKDAIRSGERRSDERRSDGDSRKSRTETSGKGASRRPIAREREGEGMHRTNASIIGRVVSISFENDDLD